MGYALFIPESFSGWDADGVACRQQAGEECAESEERGGCEETTRGKGALHPVGEDGAEKAIKGETDDNACGRAYERGAPSGREIRRHDTYCSNPSCSPSTRFCWFGAGRSARDRSAKQALKSCDKLCSSERASAALGPPKRGKILSTILQKQIREARCSIEHRTHGH